MLCADGVGWGQFLHGSADGGLGREKKDAVNGYEITKQIYIAENPLLNQAQHDAFMESRNGHTEITPVPSPAIQTNDLISEKEAIKMLRA